MDGLSFLTFTESGPVAHCGDITSDETWSASEDHLLTCQTFVKDGVTLTIEAGTTVKSLSDDGSGLAPALVVEQGGMIMAQGTLEAPITFTSNLTAEELAANPRGNWGGLIVNGYAPISTTGGVNFVEGLEGVPYGGSDPADNSGVISHVRVWHGGRSIGQDNEINGITLAGVGSATTVEYSEVAWNLDDGFEMFGGTVNLKYCSVVNVGDDAFDTDEGYQGKGQFLFVHRADDSDKAHEMDSKTNSDFDSQPRSHPMFSNVTVMGNNENGEDGLRLREGTGGDFRNYIIMNVTDDAIRNDDNGSELVTQDLSATAGLYPDYLYISPNTLMWNIGDQLFNDFDEDTDDGTFSSTSIVADPGLTQDGAIVDVTPVTGGPAYENVDLVADDWFTQTGYKGAFGSVNWLDGLSFLTFTEVEVDYCGTGDANLDGEIDVLDVVLIVGYILGFEIPDPDSDSPCASDYNGDGLIDVIDVVSVVGEILNSRSSDNATSVSISKNNDNVSLLANGYVGAIQITLSHSNDFSIELTNEALIAEYNTIDNTTTLIIVSPKTELFSATGNYVIEDVVAATTDGYIDVNINIPFEYAVSSAYPNPFNPITNITLDMNTDSQVNISIYNLMGQLIEVLVNEKLNAGSYPFTWNANSAPSGLYIIKTNVGSTTSLQKVMLVK